MVRRLDGDVRESIAHVKEEGKLEEAQAKRHHECRDEGELHDRVAPFFAQAPMQSAYTHAHATR